MVNNLSIAVYDKSLSSFYNSYALLFMYDWWIELFTYLDVATTPLFLLIYKIIIININLCYFL